MRRRHRRKNNQRKIIILSVIGLMFIMVVGYSAFQTNLSINVKGNIVERSRVIQSWTSSSNEDFHTDYYKENIVSATFLDSNAVPSDAVESWDVSVDKDKGVMAYVITNTDDNTKYDLYIGANKGVIANEDSSLLFTNFINLTSIEFNNNFDTSNTTNMANMFMNCQNINELDLSSFDTSNLTKMSGMFQMFDSRTSVDTHSKLSKIVFGINFDTSKVVSMSSLFYRCNNLKEVDLNNFNTSNVSNMSGMFYATGFSTLDLSNFDTSNVTNMYAMFWWSSKLTTVNLCSFDTSKVTNMYRMFASAPNLTKIKVGPNWTTANANTTDMFTNSGVSEVTTGEC